MYIEFHTIELSCVSFELLWYLASIAMMADWLYRKGVEAIICCCACGVLDDNPAGDIIIPTRALRDDDASYKYLPPLRFINLSTALVEVFRKTLKKLNISFIEYVTWSTDSFYRETEEMTEYRKNEGCKAVEMEYATMAAVTRFRNKVFEQILYSGDILVGSDIYDDRDWYNNLSEERG